MEDIGIKIFESINFYERYTSLSEKTRGNENRLEKIDKLKVLEFLKQSGGKPVFVSKGQFFRITDSINHWNLSLHLSIKYGLVEVILGIQNDVSGIVIGGPVSIICESIEYARGTITSEYVKKPSFSNYEVLNEILKEIFGIYEDLKLRVIELDDV